MPSSQVSQVSVIMQQVLALRPASILDIGIGFGKFGFLCREYLELWDGREKYNDWRCRIDGIEAFPDYVTDLQRMIYSNIYIGDARTIVPNLESTYDLIMLIDVIEHFEKAEGLALLAACAKRCNQLIVSTPRVVSPQEAAFGNEFEIHRSHWTAADCASIGAMTLLPNPHSLIACISSRSASINRIAQLERSPLQQV